MYSFEFFTILLAGIIFCIPVIFFLFKFAQTNTVSLLQYKNSPFEKVDSTLEQEYFLNCSRNILSQKKVSGLGITQKHSEKIHDLLFLFQEKTNFLFNNNYIYSFEKPSTSSTHEDARTLEKILSSMTKNFKNKKNIKFIFLSHFEYTKNLLIQHIALQTAKKQGAFKGYTPFLIQLEDIFAIKDQETLPLHETLFKYFKLPSISSLTFQEILKQNQALFILDISGKKNKISTYKKYARWLSQKEFQNNPIIFVGNFNLLPHLKYFQAIWYEAQVFFFQKMDRKRIVEFCYHWFNFSKKDKRSNQSKELELITRQKAQAITSKIFTYLNKNNDRGEMLSPFRLLITLFVYNERNKIILNQERLYIVAIQIIAQKHYLKFPQNHQDKGYTEYSVILHISHLASQMMALKKKSVRLEELDCKLYQQIQGRPYEKFIHAMIEDSDFLSHSDQKISFVHYNLQEFLTAYYFYKFSQNGFVIFDSHKIVSYENSILSYFHLLGVGEKENALHYIGNSLNDEKEFWRSMPIWEKCLRNIEDKSFREEAENIFCLHTIKMLKECSNDTKNDDRIRSVSLFYGLQKNAKLTLSSFMQSKNMKQMHFQAQELYTRFLIYKTTPATRNLVLREQGKKIQQKLCAIRNEKDEINFIYEKRGILRFFLLSCNIERWLELFDLFTFMPISIKILTYADLCGLNSIKEIKNFEKFKSLYDLNDLRDEHYNKKQNYLEYLRDFRDFYHDAEKEEPNSSLTTKDKEKIQRLNRIKNFALSLEIKKIPCFIDNRKIQHMFLQPYHEYIFDLINAGKNRGITDNIDTSNIPIFMEETSSFSEEKIKKIGNFIEEEIKRIRKKLLSLAYVDIQESLIMPQPLINQENA